MLLRLAGRATSPHARLAKTLGNVDVRPILLVSSRLPPLVAPPLPKARLGQKGGVYHVINRPAASSSYARG